MADYEYIVVGGGSAGMAVAARLSQRGHRTLLLEAGPERLGPTRSWIVRMPSAYGYAYRNPLINWLYHGEPEPFLNNRRMYQPRGKILGGSSAVNGLGFLRPHPGVFGRWVQEGAAGWSFAEVLPFFKRLETWHGAPSSLRGTDGPIHVAKGELHCSYYNVFFAAGQEAGFSFSDDINSEEAEGFAAFQANLDSGERASTAHGYLKYVANREALSIIGRAHVARLLWASHRVVGVEYLRQGRLQSAMAEGEVIVACGTFNSPQLLMLSGIGPADELRQLSIPVRVALDGVGKNLQDHPIIYPKYEATVLDSPVKYNSPMRKLLVEIQWLLSRTGPATSNQMEAVALLRSAGTVPFPDIEFQFCPLVLDHDAGGVKDIHGWSNSCGPVTVEGRGWVKLRSDSAVDAPRIFCNFMSTDRDIDLMFRAHQLNRELMNTPSFRRLTRRVISTGAAATDREEVFEYLRGEVSGDYHPVGTCKIGRENDRMAVVDSKLRVYGVDGLRVADASVMPSIPNANTNATAIMIGERAAAFLADPL